jgi:hypothetical protein
MYLLHHATAAQRDTFLQAATNLPRDPQSPQVSFVGLTRRPAAISWPLYRFFVTLEDFPAAFSLGTIWRSALNSMSFEPCSLHSRLATAAPSLGISCRSMTFPLRSWIFTSRMEWNMASNNSSDPSHFWHQLWRVRVAPLINVGSRSFTSVYWISHISL